MTIISIEKATILDTEKLTEIMTKTFDEEAKRWLCGQGDGIDYNIQPPGYSSVEMMKYSIEELDCYKVVMDEKIIGGIIVTISGKSYGRIDRIFVDPVYQGKGIGSFVIKLIEEEYPSIRIWDLETSSRQINNHHFYKKMGYEIIFKSEDEYCYVKRITVKSAEEKQIKNQDLKNSQYENCNLANTEYYQVNLKNSSFVGSNIMHMNMSNCNVSQSKFRNINLKSSLYADLNLSGSKFSFVTLGGVHFKDTSLGEDKHPILFNRCDFEGSTISNSNLKNMEIENCDITGMKINGIPIENLLELYNKVKS
ncbi:GNAT family N-acetyltransferase [Bacillus albus]|uniref:GNAT family N-acetyltransferase n=1 Tax=Bacillus TaxID=1386 RepID=UPI00141A4D48|nr:MULTISPECIES: GNAT family N-acetyltransferase [Bacillus cereus group]MBU5215308.1 GNAT family N-acetyltransferase [Bacillus albus]MDA2029918.1 GNAT family N-acetyltransferase [Bacillus cereus group sp. Bcc03]MDA2215875.1 GNAT family N-acetyltransferase [Bacillus cereus group sp. Bc228]MDA2225748.1 GNAT family N-acetyltransferase [Bacillus cereus group sp. Bc227]MDA2260212.1 GNAT family N-acetyltransferase [Bacillus cereus group sp. Bc200]